MVLLSTQVVVFSRQLYQVLSGWIGPSGGASRCTPLPPALMRSALPTRLRSVPQRGGTLVLTGHNIRSDGVKLRLISLIVVNAESEKRALSGRLEAPLLVPNSAACFLLVCSYSGSYARVHARMLVPCSFARTQLVHSPRPLCSYDSCPRVGTEVSQQG